MDNLDKAKQDLRNLFDSQNLSVLSTSQDDRPYASLVGFVSSDDLKSLFFATTRSTRKYANLIRNPSVAMLIDSRSNKDSDFHEAIAATALGIAGELKGREREAHIKPYLAKHPHLVDFVNAPTCAFIRVKIECYYVVTRFQNVIEVHIGE